MSILTRFFTLPPLTRTTIAKPASIINIITPNLYTELQSSSKQFIKGLVAKDVEFVKNVTARELGDRLQSQMLQIGDQELDNLSRSSVYDIDTCANFVIQPYVVFGDNFKERIQRKNINEGVLAPLSNKYFRYNSSLGISGALKSFRNKHIYGFNCFYLPRNIRPQSPPNVHEYLISFETDSENIEFFIVDCQGALLEEHSKKVDIGK